MVNVNVAVVNIQNCFGFWLKRESMHVYSMFNMHDYKAWTWIVQCVVRCLSTFVFICNFISNAQFVCVQFVLIRHIVKWHYSWERKRRFVCVCSCVCFSMFVVLYFIVCFVVLYCGVCNCVFGMLQIAISNTLKCADFRWIWKLSKLIAMCFIFVNSITFRISCWMH